MVSRMLVDDSMIMGGSGGREGTGVGLDIDGSRSPSLTRLCFVLRSYSAVGCLRAIRDPASEGANDENSDMDRADDGAGEEDLKGGATEPDGYRCRRLG